MEILKKIKTECELFLGFTPDSEDKALLDAAVEAGDWYNGDAAEDFALRIWFICEEEELCRNKANATG